MRAFRLIALALTAALVPAAAPMAAAAHPRPMRLVFAATVVGRVAQIYSIEPSGRGAAQLTFGSRSSSDPVPSPDGARIAFERNGSLWVMRPDGRGQRQVARSATDPAWTPDSRRIAYVEINDVDESLGIHVVGANGRRDRLLVRGQAFGPAWSPDGSALAFDRHGELDVLSRGRVRAIVRDPDIFRIDAIRWSFDGRWLAYAAAGKIDVLRSNGTQRRELDGAYPPVWSPRSLLLAFVTGGNVVQVVNVFAPRSGRVRRLGDAALGVDSLAWSPRGDAVAFAGGFQSAEDLAAGSQLGVFTLAGHRRLLGAASAYPLPDALGWTTPSVGVRYRRPPPLGPLVSRDQLALREPVDELAADGDRVAYRSCGTIAVWKPGDTNVVSQQIDRPLCAETNIGFYSIALAGDRIAWGSLRGGNTQSNSLVVETVGDPSVRTEVASGSHTTGDQRGDERAGDILGAGPLLVFSTWAYCDEVAPVTCPGLGYGQGPSVATQTLWRVREPTWAGECPRKGPDATAGRCEQLRVEPGPLRPLDADAGRIVVSGDNATLVLDPDGRPLLSLPVSTQAAQLAGPDLVLLVRGALRDYDVTTGALLHTWPLPDVSSGGFCGVPVLLCGSPRLELEDAANGLVAYVLDGQIHVLRLDDGRDVSLHAGTIARFGSVGLFYAYQASGIWPGRIRFVPTDQLRRPRLRSVDGVVDEHQPHRPESGSGLG